MNAIQENGLVELFKSNYPDFPVGTLEKVAPPLPDYVVTAQTGKIGIELTEVFHPGRAKEQASFKDMITELVIALLDPVFPFRFSLDVFPDKAATISKANYREFAQEIANTCKREFYRLQDGQMGK